MIRRYPLADIKESNKALFGNFFKKYSQPHAVVNTHEKMHTVKYCSYKMNFDIPERYRKHYSDKYFFSPRNILLAFFGLAIGVVVIFIFFYLPYRKYRPMKFEKSYSFVMEKKIQEKGYLYVNDSLQIQPLYSVSDTWHVWLDDFIQIGDSILKEKNTHRVSVIRDGRTYLFSPGGE